jgi:preprotein translocase subunit YajC
LSSNSIYMIVIVVVFIGLFYFMGIRPQSKQRKVHEQMMSSLTRGDVVMTGSGIYGKVVKADDKVVEIEIAKGVTMKVTRRAIADIIKDKERARALAPAASGSTSARSKQSALDEQAGSGDAGEGEDNGAES